MPEVKLPDVTLSFQNLVNAVALLVCIAGVLVAIVKGWEALNKISVRGRVKNLETRMTKVEDRLKAGDRMFELQSKDMAQTLATLQSLLIHFISGNDHDRLKEQLKDLTNYISNRGVQNEHEREGNNG